MRRRAVLAVFGGVAWAVPLVARAQQPPRTPVIGYLGSETAERFASRLDAFREGLKATGFAEGRNVAIDYRWAEGHAERLPVLAAELVGGRVNVIVAPGSIVSALAAKAATSTIPIVFEIGADPIASGLVASLNRPAGNITGVTSLNVELAAKRLELLHELVPRADSVALLVNPTNPNAEPTATQMRSAASALGLKLHLLRASAEPDFDAVFQSARQLRAGGLVITADLFLTSRARQLASLALRHAVPVIAHTREFPEAGGLMSYGGVFAETHRQAGVYTGRILKGEKPADLPVQQVTTFALVINLKTAKALGLAIPQAMLLRADEVIE